MHDKNTFKNNAISSYYNIGFVFLCRRTHGRIDILSIVTDSDYYSSKREGHILAKMTNHSSTTAIIESGEGFMQGIFLQFGITYSDNATEERQGGFGSANK